ncbi:MAG: hypothetical protein DRR42_07145 [Gammaproteobacteria bacterium]|nr:MAG: hypothetical protein DRR42_07145 [Gammaproteobacteria bacterium]
MIQWILEKWPLKFLNRRFVAIFVSLSILVGIVDPLLRPATATMGLPAVLFCLFGTIVFLGPFFQMSLATFVINPKFRLEDMRSELSCFGLCSFLIFGIGVYELIGAGCVLRNYC